MKLMVDESGPFAIATLSGSFDIDDANLMAESLHPLVAPTDARLAIDLSGLSQINSAGLGVLINIVTRARLSGSRVVIIAPSPFIRQVFEVTRLSDWFDIVADRREAAAALAD